MSSFRVMVLSVFALIFANTSVMADDLSIQVFQSANTQIEYLHGYVDPKDIYFSNNRIYVMQDGVLEAVDSIAADDFSIYFKKSFPSNKSPWECPRCSHVNVKEATYCSNCLWDPEKDEIPYTKGK